MTTLNQEKKVAVLLHALGPAAADVLNHVEINRANRIQNELNQINDEPLDTETIEEVLDDFDRFFRFAMEAVNAETYWTHLIDEEENAPIESQALAVFDGDDDDDEEQIRFATFEPGDDPINDLNRLHPIQIAAALKDDDPRTIAVVLGSLKQAHAAECVKLLPQEVQGDVMSTMMSKTRLPDLVLRRIVATTVARGLEVTKPEKPEPTAEEKVASVLRELPRTVRSRIMDHLKEKNGDEVEALQRMLYVFEDLLNYDDRSVQKILAEVEKSQLVTALQDCPEEISEKIYSNLSKRARSAMQEEMEYASKESETVVNEAREAIARVIAELDQSEQIQTI